MQAKAGHDARLSPQKTDLPLYHKLNPELDEIRLLKVDAGVGDRPLVCELLHASLLSDPEPQYETVSYCWGDSLTTETVILNGVQQEVPLSAAVAVRRIRLPDADRLVWIDAICINQDDRREKGHQVAAMHKIYSRPTRNLVWLGEGDGSDFEILRAVDLVLADAKNETDGYARFTETLIDGNSRHAHASTGIEASREEIEPAALLYNRPWFRRGWIVQETVLAPVSLCLVGSHERALDDVLRCAAWLRYKSRFHFISPSAPQSGLSHATTLFDIRVYKSLGSLNLAALIGHLKSFDTSDPRDHIYATLGLYQAVCAPHHLFGLLTPDYHRPLAAVLRDATRFIMVETGDSDHFRVVDHHPRGQDTDSILPSWVPPWHESSYGAETRPLLGGFFCAHDDRRLDIGLLSGEGDPKQVAMIGFCIDIVHEVHDIGQVKQIDLFHTIGSLLEQSSRQYDDTNISRTLIAGGNSAFEAATEQDCADVALWQDCLLGHNGKVPSAREAEQNASNNGVMIRARRYNFCVERAMRRRAPFLTNTGYVGLGPSTIRVGDLVVILSGCSCPVILRECAELYEMIGLAYIDGIMYGEAARQHRAEGKPDQTFTIC